MGELDLPEELIERAAEAMFSDHISDWTSLCPPHIRERWREQARVALAAVLPDLIAAIEAEYEQVVLVDEYGHLLEAGLLDREAFTDEEWATEFGNQRSVFVRRVP